MPAIRWGLVLGVCLAAAPSGAEDAPPAPGKPPTERGTPTPEESAARHTRLLQKKVTQLRALSFKHDVPIRLQTELELRARVLHELAEEYPPRRLDGVQKAGIRLGLFPEKFDLVKTLTDVLSEQIAGFYDPKRKELYVIQRSAADGGLPEAEALVEMLTGIAAQDVFAIHELTHAAQDQTFDLETLPIEVTDNDDLVLALKAVVEGDATYVMFDCLARSLGVNVDQLAAAGISAESLPFEGRAQRAPEFVKQSLIFPYLSGFEFVQRAKGRGGWERVGALYDDPPASSEQIMHPGKYFGAERDAPTLLRWGALAALPAPAWRMLESNVLGEFGVGVMLKTRGGPSPSRAAAGWDGDRYQLYERAQGGRLLLLWASTWDTEQDAAEFADSLAAVLGARAGAGALPAPAEGWRGWGQGDESAWLFVAGIDVFAADGVEGAAAPDKLMAEWRQGLTREVVTKVARVPRKAPAAEKGKKAPDPERRY